MNRSKPWAGIGGLVFCGIVVVALTGCPPYEGQPQSGGAYYGPSGPGDDSYVEIRAESDFYEPLSPYGRWEMVGSSGRCWIPGGVSADWSPYSNGYWQRTDAGWYWASDEPWGWATYHYGRWDSNPQYGWYWVPQTQWAPAWVSWREGGGYVGWAPLGPSGRAVVEGNRRGSAPGGYHFVEERRFLDPVRSTTIIVNNTVINKTVINEGPGPAAIERASGRAMQAVPVRQLRSREEASVVAKHPSPTATRAPAVPAPGRNQTETARPARDPQPRPVEQKATPVAVRNQAAPARPTRESQPPAVTNEVRPAAGQSPAAKRDEEKRVQQQPARENARPPPAAVAAKPENRPQANHETPQTQPQAKKDMAPVTKHETPPQANHETPQTQPQAKHETTAPVATREIQPQAKHETKPVAERPAATKERTDQKPGKDDKKED